MSCQRPKPVKMKEEQVPPHLSGLKQLRKTLMDCQRPCFKSGRAVKPTRSLFIGGPTESAAGNISTNPLGRRNPGALGQSGCRCFPNRAKPTRKPNDAQTAFCQITFCCRSLPIGACEHAEIGLQQPKASVSALFQGPGSDGNKGLILGRSRFTAFCLTFQNHRPILPVARHKTDRVLKGAFSQVQNILQRRNAALQEKLAIDAFACKEMV